MTILLATPMPLNLSLQNVGVPIAFVIIGILANLLGKADGSTEHKLNCFAVGTSTLLMSLATTISDLSRATTDHENLVSLLSWVVIFFVMILISLNVDRYTSWEMKNGKPTNKKRPVVGVVIPNIASVAIFIIYSNSVSG